MIMTKGRFASGVTKQTLINTQECLDMAQKDKTYIGQLTLAYASYFASACANIKRENTLCMPHFTAEYRPDLPNYLLQFGIIETINRMSKADGCWVTGIDLSFGRGGQVAVSCVSAKVMQTGEVDLSDQTETTNHRIRGYRAAAQAVSNDVKRYFSAHPRNLNKALFQALKIS